MSYPAIVGAMSEPTEQEQVDAALNAGAEENFQRVTIVDEDPERAKRIAEALALDSDEGAPTTN